MKDQPIVWLLVGALLGGVINAAIRQYAAFKESKGIALAIRGEISALIEIVLQRRYLEHLETFIQQLSDPSHQLAPKDFFAPRMAETYFPVFNSLANKIGALADLGDNVAIFYTKAKSVIEDTHALEDMRAKMMAASMEVDRAATLELTTELRDLLHDALRIGIQTVEDLKNFQERRWFLGMR